MELPVATSDTQELISYGLRAVEALYRQGLQFKKGGVMLTDLVVSKQVQQNLFDTLLKTSLRLMQAVDKVNAHMRTGTIRFAVAGINPQWKVLANHKSKRYSTSWDELVQVKT
jgi:DNA polymerase V